MVGWFNRLGTPPRHAPLPGEWYERDAGARFAADRALLANDYPLLQASIDHHKKLVSYEGDLSYEAQCGLPVCVRVRIELPKNYPEGEPKALDLSGRFIHDEDGHFFSGTNRCCLWLSVTSEWEGAAPSALRDFVDQVWVFFHRQLIFQASNRTEWPGKAWAHGREGYKEWIGEQLNLDRTTVDDLWPAFTAFKEYPRYDLCPCGSGKKFKWCHQDRVQELRERIGRARLSSWG